MLKRILNGLYFQCLQQGDLLFGMKLYKKFKKGFTQKNMKKLFQILLFFIFFALSCKCFANPYLRAELSGAPIIEKNNILANLNIAYIQNDISKLYIKSQEAYLLNNENQNVKIPINKLYLISDGNEFQINNTGWQNFYTSNEAEGNLFHKNINLRLENIGELPAGRYSCLLKFLNRNIFGDFECDFLFAFTVDEKQLIVPTSGEPLIALSSEDVFKKGNTIKNQTDTTLNLNSNTNWSLWLLTSNFSNDEYFVFIKNANGKILNYQKEAIKLMPNQKYLLAKGSATLEGIEPLNNVPTSITLEYSHKNANADSYPKEGIKQMHLTYLMEREQI